MPQTINGVEVGEAALGGSGAEYSSIAAALAGEADVVFAGVTQAGTTEGIVSSAAFPATDDALNGFVVVDTDTSPGNGLAGLARRITDYVAAGKLATIDGTEDIGAAGESVAAINPAKITLKHSLTEDVTITKNVSLSGGGNILNGQVNIGAGATFVEIHDLEILDGLFITTATPSFIKLVNVIVHRREASIYAIRRSTASNVGRIEADNLETYGVFSCTQGRAAYVLKDCLFQGVDDGDGNLPFRAWDADGVAIVADNGLIVMQNCSNPGSILFSDGAGGNLAFTGWFQADLDMRCRISGDPANTIPADDCSFGVCRGASTFSFAPTLGDINMKLPYNCVNSLLRCDSFTGTATMNFSTPGGFAEIDVKDSQEAHCVLFTGTAFTGTATFTGSDTLGIMGDNTVVGIVTYRAPSSTGTCNVTNTGAINVQGASQVLIVSFGANQTAAPGPTTTVSPSLNFDDIPFGIFATPVLVASPAVTDIDFGTTTISSLVTGNSLGALHRNMASVFGGHSVTISGIWRCAFAAGRDGFDLVMRVARHGGTAGTLTCSAAFFGFGPWFGSFPQLGHAVGAGATVVVSGARTLYGVKTDGVFAFLFAATATSVVSGGGAITLINCVMQASGIEIADSDVAGASVTVPSAATLRFCTFEGSFATRTDPDGTYVGSCNVFIDHCTILGSFTPHGTNFPSVFCGMSNFNGDPDALLFTATSQADPATLFTFWRCAFPNGRYYVLNNSLTLGKPVVVDTGTVDNAGAALTAERLGEYDSTARLINLAAAANNVACVFTQGAAGAAGTRQRGIIDGKGFGVADGVINQGDSVEPGAGTPSRVQAASVERVGVVLDAAAFPTAAGDRVYMHIRVKR